MHNPHYRYFIELQPLYSAPLSRSEETEARHKSALNFLETVRHWLHQKELHEKVSALNVTMFGQIQITCEADVISLIRSDDVIDIAAIRQSPGYLESRLVRGEAR